MFESKKWICLGNKAKLKNRVCFVSFWERHDRKLRYAFLLSTKFNFLFEVYEYKTSNDQRVS